MTNEETIKNMNREELGSFLCGITIKCEYRELKHLSSSIYGKGFYDWLGAECNGDIYNGFWSVENLPDYSLNRDFTPFTTFALPMKYKDKLKMIFLKFIKRKQNQIFIKGSEIVSKEYTTLKSPFLLIFSTGKSTEFIFLETEEDILEMIEGIKQRGGKVLEAIEIASCRKIEI